MKEKTHFWPFLRIFAMNFLGKEAFVYDESFKGPVTTRDKTDGSFIVIFSVAMTGWLLLGIWGEFYTISPA